MEDHGCTPTLEMRYHSDCGPKYTYSNDSLISDYREPIGINFFSTLSTAQDFDTALSYNTAWNNRRIFTQTKRLVLQWESDRPEKDIRYVSRWTRNVRHLLRGLRKIERSWVAAEHNGRTVWKFGYDLESDLADIEEDLLMVDHEWTEKGETLKAQE
jgi:hypothetical protein